MYQLGLKPLPHVPPKTMGEDVMGRGERVSAPACRPQMSFLQLSRSFSLTVSNVSKRSSDPKQ
jgi:hypothetical protein